MRTPFCQSFLSRVLLWLSSEQIIFFFSFKKRTLKISIGAIIKDPGMLRLVHKHVKMCKHAAKKLSFLIKYLPG